MGIMFAKIFSHILDSSIAEDYLVRLVFEDLLILADRDGVVDMTPRAISARTNVPLEVVERGLAALSAPDLHSRNPKEDGKRILPLDDHRSWGWKIVNYDEYRKIRDDEARRSYFREYQKNRRASLKESTTSPIVTNDHSMSLTVKLCQPIVEGEAEEKSTAQAPVRFAANDIERIYQAYPRKVGRGAALLAIRKALQSIDDPTPVESLLAIVEVYARSPAGNSEQFTPHPSTWFNQKRYLDNQKEWEKAR